MSIELGPSLDLEVGGRWRSSLERSLGRAGGTARISAQANTPGSAPAGIWENKFGLSGKQIRRRYFPLQRRLYWSAALCEAHCSSVSSFLFGPFVNYFGGSSFGPLSIIVVAVVWAPCRLLWWWKFGPFVDCGLPKPLCWAIYSTPDHEFFFCMLSRR